VQYIIFSMRKIHKRHSLLDTFEKKLDQLDPIGER
jgi:hypothetical protein